jgi:hypothetical protein
MGGSLRLQEDIALGHFQVNAGTSRDGRVARATGSARN